MPNFKVLNRFGFLKTTGPTGPVPDIWTPADVSGAGLTFTTAFASYFVKFGSLVFITLDVHYPVTASSAQAQIGGLPYTSGNAQYGLAIAWTDTVGHVYAQVGQSGTKIVLYVAPGGANLANSALSNKNLRLSGFYFVP